MEEQGIEHESIWCEAKMMTIEALSAHLHVNLIDSDYCHITSNEQCWDISIAIGKSPAIVSYMVYVSRHHKGPGIHADNN